MSTATMESLNLRIDDELIECIYAPYRFVNRFFPWGVQGTPLASYDGPDTWQAEELEAVGQGLQLGSYRSAVASGHGVGKSALTAWLILWFISTRPHPQIVCTANTKPQLDTKTWRELAKWHKLMLHADRYKWTATKFYHVDHPETWFAASVPWSQDRPEAFAGTHEAHVAMLFDEASAIPDVIWETAEGAMTTPGALWLAFGNPTRNTGRFKECFPGGRFASRWNTVQVDSRQAAMADQTQIADWIADYGDDSDFVRVRIKGVFPRTSALQFIGEDVVQTACQRQPIAQPWAPIVIGVDVARFGDDKTVLIARQGQQIIEKAVYRGIDTMQTSSLVAKWLDSFDAQAAFVDVVGIGAGVVDRSRQLGYGGRVIAVNAGERADDSQRYCNKRAEMWAGMRDWLIEAGCLDDEDRELCADLLGPEYGWDVRERLQLERKVDMKKRGLSSPDEGDALALTFAQPVAAVDISASRPRARQAHGVNVNPMSRW